ncbi:MAG TPA: hypothetical protein VNK92_02125 [Vicinamibacterales bacterium]|nr:hypothetical protein [Vicinamibacterales bacterium]
MKTTPFRHVPGREPITVEVHGPHSASPDPTARARPPSAESAGGSPLDACTKIVALRGEQAAGVAFFDRADRVVFVRAVALSPEEDDSAATNALIEAVELACQAGGSSRLVVPAGTPAVDRVLRRRGYVRHAAECTGWFEKTFP